MDWISTFTSICLNTGWSKKTTSNFGGHFDILPEKLYNLCLIAIKGSLFGIRCENMNDIAFILCKI